MQPLACMTMSCQLSNEQGSQWCIVIEQVQRTTWVSGATLNLLSKGSVMRCDSVDDVKSKSRIQCFDSVTRNNERFLLQHAQGIHMLHAM